MSVSQESSEQTENAFIRLGELEIYAGNGNAPLLLEIVVTDSLTLREIDELPAIVLEYNEPVDVFWVIDDLTS